jgi:hypothetical protein
MNNYRRLFAKLSTAIGSFSLSPKAEGGSPTGGLPLSIEWDLRITA